MTCSNDPSKHPAGRHDGDAVVLKGVREIGRYRTLELGFPSRLVPQQLFGKYVLARCAADARDAYRSNWDIYLRRPLFIIAAAPIPGDGEVSALRLFVPSVADPGCEWLMALTPGQSVNLLGPFGRDTVLNAHAKRLLLLSTGADAPLLIPIAEWMLDQAGKVAFIVRGPSADRSLLSLLPIDVELNIAESEEQFQSLLGNSIRWSDALIACESAISPLSLIDEVHRHRLVAEYDYAQILVRADLLCGVGACMACVVQRNDGSLTRACVHGPVFPLRDLVR